MHRTMNRWLGGLLVVALLLSLLPALVVPKPAAAATTSLTVTKYDAHGSVLSTQTVTYQWMEANLPVQGDGTTHYYAQGPTFTNTNFNTVWNPAEDVNVDSRDYGASQGNRRQRPVQPCWGHSRLHHQDQGRRQLLQVV